MPAITVPEVEAYLAALYDDGDPIRREMEAYAAVARFPIVGPLVGRHLHQLALMIGARRVFELGSGYGYSALHFARAVGAQGIVHCTELSEENIARGGAYLQRAGFIDRVRFHREEATAALRRVGGTYDIVFCDIDKDGYPDVVELAHAHLRPGGLFITDNVLWSGRVLPGHGDGSAATQGVASFTRLLFAHPGFDTTILPVRDGVAVAVRL